jgi:hypothetical protein
MVAEGADGRLDRIVCIPTVTRACWNLLAVIGVTMLGCLLGLVLAPGSAEAAAIQNTGTHGARAPVTDVPVTQLALVASLGPTSSLTARSVSDYQAIGRTATGRHGSRPKEAPLAMLTPEYVAPPTAPTEPYGPWSMVQNLLSLVEGGAPGTDGGIAVLLCAVFLVFPWTFRRVVGECPGRYMWLFLQPLVRPG